MTLKSLAVSSMSILFAGSAAVAATPVIGMASAQNGITLNSSRVSGNATLFEGSTVETSGYSRIELNNGTRMDLGAGSQVKIYTNHATLDRGASQFQSGSGFEIEASSLKIRTSGGSSVALVKMDKQGVTVEARNAPVEVSNSSGFLIARVTPGLPLAFMPQAGSSTSFDSTGCVLQKAGAALIVDGTSKQTYELRGADLRKVIGNQAHVTGSVDSSATAAGGASQVVKVTTVNITTKGGCSSAATAIGASTAAAGLGAAAATGVAAGAAVGAGAAAGISTGLIVAGVAVAAGASVGIAAGVGAFSSSP